MKLSIISATLLLSILLGCTAPVKHKVVKQADTLNPITTNGDIKKANETPRPPLNR